MRLGNRAGGRAGVFIALALATGLGIGLGRLGTPDPIAGTGFLYVVRQGDTLDALARCLGQPVDARALVATLQDRNPGPLRAGQRLYVPDEIAGGHLCPRLAE